MGSNIPNLIRQQLSSVLNFNTLDDLKSQLMEKAILGYVLNVYDFNEFYHTVKDFISWKHAQDIKQKCFESYEFLKLKIAIYKIIEDNLNRKSDIKLYFKKAELNKSDYLIYEDLRSMEELYLKCKKKARKIEMDIEIPNNVRKNCNELMGNIDGYIKRFVNAKHHFIVKSQGISAEDISNDLRLRAVSTYYHVYPFKPSDAMIGMVKRAIHNHGINLIEYYTTKKRGRIINIEGSGVFESNIHSLDISDDNGSAIIDTLDSGFTYESIMINTSISNIMKNSKSKERKIMKLLLRCNSKSFISFVNNKLNKKWDSTKQISTNISNDQYLNLIQEYMGMDTRSFNKKLVRLKNQIL